ncbi:cyclin H [Fonsecaea erecta]|uniref:RNA polymerase II holoenzyme cyclin-like subunit n=1 Tax=Fonsecaea erecta TaxID=1367422 RepID=A0A178ZXD7_9EURO|nr:cyclin H [Fonsecaea erecta]OAP64479.1 cyclin H [Fonsecaea erecta]
MIEDDEYRASSQYRYWSYTEERLAQIRQKTNRLASERVKAAIRKTQITISGSSENSGNTADTPPDVPTLTAEEELKIVEWGCTKIVDMGEAMNPRIPSSIVATAIQYLRRFYLTHSPMIYHPKPIMVCALYLATKADHFYISLSKFVSELEKVTEQDVKAPEFLLLQGLKFTLDVRHPMKGLAGGHAEMLAMVQEGQLGSNSPKATSFARRVDSAADQAKGILTRAAQMTDAYFLYTPSQIWLGAMMVADSELTEVYLEHKLGNLPFDEATATFKQRVLTTIVACAKLLSSYRSPEDSTRRKELTRIRKKLTVCQDPEKVDIDAVSRGRAKLSEKRDGHGSDAEKALKKRKLEREKLEKDGEVFGPELRSISG